MSELSETYSEEYLRNEKANLYHSRTLAGVNEQFHLYLRDQIISEVGGRSALELGCGKGLWTKELCKIYNYLDVVDESESLLLEVLAKCKDRAELMTHVSMVEDFFLGTSKSWQHIYMTFLLEHLADPISVLVSIRKHLEKDGKLFIAVPNTNSVHRVLALRAGLIKCLDELSLNDIKLGHRRVYTRDLLLNHLHAARFHVEKELSVGLKPFALQQLEHLPQEVVRALCESGDLVPNNSAYMAMILVPR